MEYSIPSRVYPISVKSQKGNGQCCFEAVCIFNEMDLELNNNNGGLVGFEATRAILEHHESYVVRVFWCKTLRQ